MKTGSFIFNFTIVPLIASGFSTFLAAEDVHIRDIRLELGATPAPHEVSDTYTRGSRSNGPNGTFTEVNNNTTDGYGRISFTGANLFSAGGFVWGGGFQTSGGTFTLEQKTGNKVYDSLGYSDYGPYIFLGYGHSMGPNFHFEITPFVGLGITDVTWWDSSTNGYLYNEKGTGSYQEGGLRVAVIFDHWRHVVLGVTGGYIATSSKSTVDFVSTGGHSELSWTTEGGYVGATGGFRF